MKKTSRKPQGTAKSRITLHKQVSPPVITINSMSDYVKNGEKITLEGRVEDENRDIRDVAVWINDDKVFLKTGASMSNPRSIPFKVDLKLKPGPNFITVIAREGYKFSSQLTRVITRPGGLDFKEDKKSLTEGDASLVLE